MRRLGLVVGLWASSPAGLGQGDGGGGGGDSKLRTERGKSAHLHSLLPSFQACLTIGGVAQVVQRKLRLGFIVFCVTAACLTTFDSLSAFPGRSLLGESPRAQGVWQRDSKDNLTLLQPRQLA